ncbi:hypothetical protein [Microseira sp. BLCC-F43]|jgi:hypothetical protein|uniref:hypothetical protein n=1 Tax=Microseira sp. BLCC-F43 TaxID=3153602 RepID=UPI0035B736D3
MSEQIWNMLHDGCIDSISGNIPGKVQVRVNILYLRQMFSEDGKSIIVTLDNCQKFEYEPYGSSSRFTELSVIESRSLEILSADSHDNDIHIFCVEGTIYLRHSGISLALDTGRQITVVELENACRKYWDKFAEKNKLD